MVRRSFRFGLWVGLLVGIGFAVYKTMQARRTMRETAAAPQRDPWPPMTRVEPEDERPAPEPVAEHEPEPAAGAATDEMEMDPDVETEADAVSSLEVVPAPAAALEERTGPAPAAMVAPEPAEVAIPEPPAPSGLRLVRPPADEPAQKWVEPVSADTCPESHPIKVKLSSRLFHLPGMFAYARTKPDRCYDTEQGAADDGFTRAKR
jgi:hypothetical protein